MIILFHQNAIEIKLPAIFLESTNKFWYAENLRTLYLSWWQESDKNFLDPKHVLKPKRKTQNFGFLPVPILLHLIEN